MTPQSEDFSAWNNELAVQAELADHGPAMGTMVRFLQLDTTVDNAGRITGDLTPECSANVQAGLGALGKKRGPENDRTAAQRSYDALQEG